jgi:hypothetical protein
MTLQFTAELRDLPANTEVTGQAKSLIPATERDDATTGRAFDFKRITVAQLKQMIEQSKVKVVHVEFTDMRFNS